MPLFVRGSLALALLIGSCLAPTTMLAAELWLSPEGADDNPGTRVKPFASVGVALRQARELRRLGTLAINEPVHVILEGGIYPLADSLLVRAADSGTAGSPTIIEAAPGASVALSGGIAVTGWKKVSENVAGMPAAARGNVWEAHAPTIGGSPLRFRQLWVNGRKAIRARQPNAGSMDRLVSWDPKKQEAWIPATAVQGVDQPAGMEVVIDQDWEIAMLRVNTVRRDGDEACVTFRQPESRLEFEHPWPPVIVKARYRAPFFLANSIAFLDAPGEWFEDEQTGDVFYWPRPGEDPARAEVMAPAIKTLVRVTGSLDRPVENVQFRGITFEYTTWLRPSREGDVPLQAGMFFLDAYRLKPPGTAYHPGLDNAAWVGRPPAGISVQNADHIVFERCRFEHMAGTGLDFQSGTHDDLI
ncbi:MAG: hypothetical protein ACREE6_11575, partial [Limisphaerales bacterium]